MALETATLAVMGMMCEACSAHISRALTGLDGVESVAVDLPGGSATVTYDPAKTSLAQMKAAIEEEGYDAA